MKFVGRLTMAAAAAVLLAAPSHAEEWLFVGSRCQALGGACVAVSDGATAQYWNAALLGNQKSTYDIQLPFGASVAAIDDIIRDLDDIFEFANDNNIGDVLDDILGANNLDPAQVVALFELFGKEIATLNGDQGFLVGANASLMGRVKRVAVSAMGLAYVGVNPIVDPLNLAFSAGLDAIGNVVGTGQDRSGVLSPTGQGLANVIFAETASNPTSFTQNQAEELVFLAELAGLDTSDASTAEVINDIAKATSEAASGFPGANITNNFSGAFVQGILTFEIGVAYAQPLGEIPWIEEVPFMDWFTIGGNIKYIHGETYFAGVNYHDVDDVSDLLDELTPGKDNLTGDDSWGIDLGVTIQPVDWFRLGIVGRNINTPSFDIKVPKSLQGNRFTPGKKYDLEPQARMGVMIHPIPKWDNWLVAMDFDLTENTTEALTTYRSRQFSAGTELQIPIWKLGLAPRAGIYLNTVDRIDHSPVITFGLGLKFWNFVLDLAGGISTDRVPFEPAGGVDEIPSRIDVSAALKWTQTF